MKTGSLPYLIGLVLILALTGLGALFLEFGDIEVPVAPSGPAATDPWYALERGLTGLEAADGPEGTFEVWREADDTYDLEEVHTFAVWVIDGRTMSATGMEVLLREVSRGMTLVVHWDSDEVVALQDKPELAAAWASSPDTMDLVPRLPADATGGPEEQAPEWSDPEGMPESFWVDRTLVFAPSDHGLSLPLHDRVLRGPLGAHLVLRSLGKGRIIVMGRPRALQTSGLADEAQGAANRAFAAFVMKGGPERYRVRLPPAATEAPSPRPTGLAALVVSSLLILVAYAWRHGPSLGTRHLPPVPGTRSLAERFLAEGRYLRRHKAIKPHPKTQGDPHHDH